MTSDPDKTGRVASPVAGLVDQVSFQEGAVVKKGDVLAIVRVAELGKIRSFLRSGETANTRARDYIAIVFNGVRDIRIVFTVVTAKSR